MVSVTALNDGELTVGSRYENKVKLIGVTITVVNEITVIDPPNRLGGSKSTKTES